MTDASITPEKVASMNADTFLHHFNTRRRIFYSVIENADHPAVKEGGHLHEAAQSVMGQALDDLRVLTDNVSAGDDPRVSEALDALPELVRFALRMRGTVGIQSGVSLQNAAPAFTML